MPRTNSMFSATDAARLKVYLNSLRKHGSRGKKSGQPGRP